MQGYHDQRRFQDCHQRGRGDAASVIGNSGPGNFHCALAKYELALKIQSQVQDHRAQ